MQTTKDDLDYDKEGRKLRFNLLPRMHSSPINCLMMHPSTNGCIYVGGETSCNDIHKLKQKNITYILNCTDSIPCYFEGKSHGLHYCRKDMGTWWRHVKSEDTALTLRSFLMPALEFVLEAILKGENVLVHCLAGAHRAGTMGIICLMVFGGLEKTKAISEAKSMRPIIDPIGHFPELLGFVDTTVKEGNFSDIISRYTQSIKETEVRIARKQSSYCCIS